ncbi:EamA family transporter [Micromonospora sp. Llam7]|uniref:DMT family transporter n=1 Tax=Micromonospora tarapacensis TaxID=2835305 RepID=UPI001C82D2D2|nr:EamA family transporter [Micromonospora tarapacensis]
MVVLFYVAVVVIWGSTWVAIAYQVGDVPVAASICYRSAAAALLLFGYLLVRRTPLRFRFRQHVQMALIGTLMFSGNYLFLYTAEEKIASGLVALLFSMTLPLNVINTSIFLRKRISPIVLVATVLGIAGATIMFWPDLVGMRANAESLLGVGMALAGTMCFSLGNMVSVSSQEAGVPVVQSEAFGLLYGALILVPVVLVTGGFRVSLEPTYIISLAYLVIFGSIIGFAFYLTLLGRGGAARAGYITVLFPIVALVWSTLLESYVWTLQALCGGVLILLGSAIAITPPDRLRCMTRSAFRRTRPEAARHAAVPGPPVLDDRPDEESRTAIPR